MVEVPQGFHFAPVDEELVEFYLLPKLQGKPTVPNDSIIEANVYELQPDTLIDLYRHRGEDAWYFLSPRARIYQKGSRPSRKTEDGVGRWRASTAAKVKMAYETVPNGVRFRVNVLNYFVGTDTKNEQRSKWLMREITIPKYKIKCGENGGNNSTLDQYVMCKIYVSPVNKEDDDEPQPSGRRAGKRKRSGGHGSLTIEEAQASSSGTVSVPAQATGSSNSQAPVLQPSIPMQFSSYTATTYHPNSSAQMARPPNVGLQAPPGTSFRPQVSLNCHYDQNYMALHSPANAAYRMPQQRTMTLAPSPPWQRTMTFAPPQQQVTMTFAPPSQQLLQRPYFNGNSNDHAGPFAPQWPPYNSDPCEGSSTAQAAGDQGGATASGMRMRASDVNAGNQFVELASINSFYAGARPPTSGEAPQTEPATPIPAPQAETETDEASSLHMQDTA